MYFCQENKTSAHYVLLSSLPRRRGLEQMGLKHHCHACPKCVIVVVGGDGDGGA